MQAREPVRIGRFLSYMAWMGRAGAVAARLHEERPFDAVHHATYATYWLPSPVRTLDASRVWGPVERRGHHAAPVVARPGAGADCRRKSWISWPCAWRAGFRPPARRGERWTSDWLLNPETVAQLPRSVRDEAEILNHVLFLDHATLPRAPRRGELLYLSPLEFRKGPELALRAFARAPSDLRLRIVGDGPERPRLEALSRRLGLAERVTFEGWVELGAVATGVRAGRGGRVHGTSRGGGRVAGRGNGLWSAGRRAGARRGRHGGLLHDGSFEGSARRARIAEPDDRPPRGGHERVARRRRLRTGRAPGPWRARRDVSRSASSRRRSEGPGQPGD